MRVKSLGYDPDLGRKFFEDHGGLILGSTAAETAAEADEEADPYAYTPISMYMDAQQQHDELMPEVPQPKPRESRKRSA